MNRLICGGEIIKQYSNSTEISFIPENNSSDENFNVSWIKRSLRLSKIFSLMVIFISLVIFAGYIFNIPILQGSILGSPSTKFNSAVMFFILGMATYFIITRPKNKKINYLAQIVSIIVIVVALITFLQYIFNIYLPLDRLFFSATVDNPLPTRTRFLSSLNFVFLGLALYFLSLRKNVLLGQILGLVAGFIAYLGFITYLSDLGGMQGPNIYSQMALFSSMAHIFLCSSFLTMYPQDGLMKPLHQNGPGAYMGRVLLPAAVLVLSIMGLLVSWGEKIDIYNDHFGEVLLLTLTLIFLFSTIIWLAQRLNQIDLDRRKYQNKVVSMERFFQDTIEGIVEGIMVTNQHNQVIYLNKGMLDVLGIKGSYILNQNILDYLNEKIPSFADYYIQAEKELKPVFIDYIELFKGSDKIYLSGWIIPQINENRFNGVIISASDVTVTKEAENILESSLKEKELLLGEIHHRVKNNMQIISSLLRMQSAQVQDLEARDLLLQSQNRIKTMAMVHESLYQSENFSKIDMNSYILRLVRGLQSTYHLKDKIQYQVEVGKIMMEIDTAIPVGLLINELVTNSIKHAFSEDNDGKITVKFNRIKSEYVLEVKDNGVGIDNDIDLENISSLGFVLIRGLVDQLDGIYDIGVKEGTRVIITFKEIVFKPRI